MEFLDPFKTTPVDPSYPDWLRSFFSPQDDVHGALKALISLTRKSLVIALYGFDDEELADIVTSKLNDPDIFCQITLDKSQAGGVHERAILERCKLLHSNSVAIGTSEKGAIMHRKMVIIDGIWRISGSTNWSISGEAKQDNELTVTNNAIIAAEARHILDLEHTKARKQMMG